MSSINAKVPPLRLSAVDTPADGEIPSYQSSSGDFEWIADASGSPATPANAVQFNSNPAGTFSGSDRLLFETGLNLGRLEMKTGDTAIIAEIRGMEGSGLMLTGSDVTASAARNYIAILGENDAPDGISLNAYTRTVYLNSGGLSTSGSTIDLILSTYLNEDKAKITLNAGANGDVDIQTDGTGITEIQNATTNQGTTLSVRGNGTGDSIIQLTNDAESVSLKCDTNQKLKIDGGVQTFVFDASSATGGMTFPDGTELVSAEGTAILSTGETGATKFLREDGDGTCSWQAAGGGGGGGISSVLPLIGSTGASEYNIGTAMPWGNSSTATQAVIGLGGQPHAFPFIAPETGTVDEIGVRVTTGDAGMSLYVAIYSNDSNNLPSSLLGYATISLTSTGDIYDSSLSSNPSLTAGTAYWYSLHGDQVMYNGVIQSNTLVYLPDLGITDGLSAQTYSLKDAATTQYAVPPATLTPNTLNTTITRPYVGIKYA